jgi:hypothetical protein
MIDVYDDPSDLWSRIENENLFLKKRNESVKKWNNPLQEKYLKLFEEYGDKYGKNDGSFECENLLDDLRAFERVFKIMNWEKFKK